MNAIQLKVLAAGLQTAIAAAPEVLAVAENCVEIVKALFGAKKITVAEQDALKAHIDAVQAAALAGNEPPHWLVEPDPE